MNDDKYATTAKIICIIGIVILFVPIAVFGYAVEEWLQRLSFEWLFGKE